MDFAPRGAAGEGGMVEPLRILIADDEEGIRYAIGEYLKRRGYETALAEDGVRALEQLRDADFDILLTDLMMPGMGGLELIQETRKIRPLTVCVILTGRGSREDAIQAVREGVFEFIDKPVMQMETLGMAMDRAGAQARLLRERERILADLQREKARLEVSLAQISELYNHTLQQEEVLKSDLRQALRMQKRLLPDAFPTAGQIECFAYFCPCERLGGDIFGMIPLGANRFAIYLADVAGHGVGAAMVAVILRELIHAHRILHPDSTIFEDPAQTLGFINEGLCREGFDPPVLVTMVYAVIHGDTHEIICSCAGHPPPLACRGAQRTEFLGARGPVLGISNARTGQKDRAPAAFGHVGDFQVARIRLEPGDSIIFYSDGISEARNASGEEMGTRRLAETAGRTHGLDAAETAERIEEALFRHLGTSPRTDDMTYIVASRVEAKTAKVQGEKPSVKIMRPDEFMVPGARVEGGISAGWTGDACVVRLIGKITWQEGHALDHVFHQALKRRDASIHVDLSNCRYVDSTIVGILFHHAGDIIMHGASARVRGVFEELGVAPRFTHSNEPAPEAILAHIDAGQVSRDLVSSMILDAHAPLVKLSDANRARFGPVVEALARQKDEKAADAPRSADPPQDS